MAKKPKTQAEILKALGRMASLDSAVGGSKLPTVSGDFNAGGLPGAVEEKKKSSGGGFLSGLKNIGKTALNLLSVPQAAAFTFLQKGAHYGSGGAVKDTSWKNLGGTFRGSAYHGGAGLLEG